MAEPGTYVLVVDLQDAIELAAGALPEQIYPAGRYAYVGSAFGPGGLDRVDRHRAIAAGDCDVRHWHIDYLLGVDAATIVDVVTWPGEDRECEIAQELQGDPVQGFGASDCSCGSHLVAIDDVNVERIRDL